MKLADGVDLDRIAQATSGFAGADLANLVNEAALLAARAKRTKVEQEDLGEAIERVVAGLEKKSRVLQDDEKKVVAYHEVGHAIVGHLMPGGSKVAKISIVPRGMSALGYTLQLPTEERFLNSRKTCRGRSPRCWAADLRKRLCSARSQLELPTICSAPLTSPSRWWAPMA